jgi:NADP-dependent 3-hydroxy acid dehydrogenase YdfG/acyl carrier protein
MTKKLIDELKNLNCEYTLVYPTDSYKKNGAGNYQINPATIADFSRLTNELEKSSKFSISHVIHLWSLDVIIDENSAEKVLEDAQILGCGAMLHLIQALIPSVIKPKIWLITYAAQAVLPKQEISLSGSTLCGFGKVVSLEHPNMWGGIIDVDKELIEKNGQSLLSIINIDSGEDQLAIRGDKLYAARLINESPKPTTLKCFDVNATYLITGGLGSLGLHTTKWMIENGARNLLLIGRTKPSSDTIQALDKLRQIGVHIAIMQADVCNSEEMKKIVEQIDRTMTPLKGIIHAAGTSAHTLIRDINYSDLKALTAPKIIGAWNLHQLTKDMQLDFFVNYSSISSVWGSAGQAHYGVANHFLDTLTLYRRSKGLPATTLNWGAWEGGGMVDKKNMEELLKRGITPLSPQQGIAALENVMSNNSYSVVANVNWNQFKPLYQLTAQRLLLDDIKVELQNTVTSETAKKTTILSQLDAVAREEKITILSSYLQNALANILELNDTNLPSLEKGFFDMGIDSLMAVQLKSLLEVSLNIILPVTIIFEYSTVSSLTNYLLKQLYNWDDPITSTNTDLENNLDVLKDQIQQLSEKDAENLINLEFENLALENIL